MTTCGDISSVPSASAYTMLKTYVPIQSTSKTERESKYLSQKHFIIKYLLILTVHSTQKEMTNKWQLTPKLPSLRITENHTVIT